MFDEPHHDHGGAGETPPEKIYMRIDTNPWRKANMPSDEGVWAVCSPLVRADIIKNGFIGRPGEEVCTIEFEKSRPDRYMICYFSELDPLD